MIESADGEDRRWTCVGLSTNIIESGLDLPSVNTIVIHRADLFGLAQLYQLRGRVGRSKVRAYAYLTLRRADSDSVAGLLSPGTGAGAPYRVVSQTIATKGKREWFACGASGRVRVTRLDRHTTDTNAGFTRAHRGDVVRLPVLAAGATDLRVRADTSVPGWFYEAPRET